MAILLFIAAGLLSGSLTAAQESHIRNFQIARQNSTHVTWSWDIVDGYYSSSDIQRFSLLYQSRSLNSLRSLFIPYSSASQNAGAFTYTTSLASLNNFNGEYIMWIRVYRSSARNPPSAYSERKYVSFGQVNTFLELKVQLQPSQTCSDFLMQEASTSISTQAATEVYWLLFQKCQCTLPYDFTAEDGYFTCATSGYVIFRAKLSASNPSTDMASVLTNLVTDPDRNVRITINGVGYSVSSGPCGVTVPYLDSPHCFTLDSATRTSTAPDSATPTSTATKDDTAILAVVATMCGVMLIVVISGCVVCLVMRVWKINHRPSSTPKVKTTCDLEMASDGPSRSIPLPRGHNPVQASREAPIQPNPCYEMVNYAP